MAQEKKIGVMVKERPYALQAIQTQILYDIASMLEDQGKTLIDFFDNWRETIPKGVFRPLTVAVTGFPTILDSKNTPNMPWISFTIFNDGPNPVFMQVNEDYIQDRTPINMGENIAVNMIKPKIEKIELHCTIGLTANVRLFAVK